MKLNLSELHYNLGCVLHQRGDLAGAATAYRQAIQQDPAFAQAYQGLAVVLGEQLDDAAAIQQYEQIMQRWPNDAATYNNLACLLVKQGQMTEAIQIYRQGIEQHPDAAILYSNLGQVLEANEPIAAIAAYQQALQLQPDLTAAAVQLGFALFRQSQYDAAIPAFESAIGIEPDHAQAHLGLGLVYQAIRQWRLALLHFHQVCRPQQNYIDAFCNWATSISATDALTLTRQSCARFLRLLCDSSDQQAELPDTVKSELLSSLADTYFRLGNLLVEYGGLAQYQQAEGYYQQALQIRPGHLPFYLSLGNCLAQQQRWNAALFVFHLALAQEPQPSQIYRQLGQLCEQQQRWADAVAYYRQAMGQPALPNDAPVHYADAKTPQTLLTESLPTLRACSIQDYLHRTQRGDWTVLQMQIHPHPVVHSSIPHPLPDATAANFTPACSINQPNCDGLNCQPCLAQLACQFAPVHLGRSVYRLTSQAATPAKPCFVAHLPQAQAWITPYESAWKVNNAVAVVTADQHLLTDVSREYPGQSPICSRPHPGVQRFSPQADQLPEQIAGRVAVLAGLSGHNYFHWIVDVLPRLALLRSSGLSWRDIDGVWINAPRAAFQQETLRALGIPADKILSADDHPWIQADQLIVPAFPGHLGWPEAWALDWLRRQFLPLATTQPSPERIYISRNRAHHRRLLNEAAVIDRLQADGFVAVELESMSFAEQVGLFAQARVVIAPHGGGLTNLIFCRPGTQVVEFFAPNYVRPYYWQISQHLALQHYYALGTAFTCTPIHQLMYPSPLMEDIWLDLSTLEMALTQVGACQKL